MKENFAQRLKSLRIENGYTQRETARMLNVAQVSYLRWEQGKTEPNINNICALCEIFNVTADYLLGTSDDFDVVLYKNDPPPLTPEEQMLTERYRRLSTEKRQALLKLLEDK